MQSNYPCNLLSGAGTFHRKHRVWPPACMREPPKASALTCRHWLLPGLWMGVRNSQPVPSLRR